MKRAQQRRLELHTQPSYPPNALHCFVFAWYADPGDVGTENNLFKESQSHFDAPTDVGVQLVDALRSESHPPVPPFRDALVPSAGLLSVGEQVAKAQAVGQLH